MKVLYKVIFSISIKFTNSLVIIFHNSVIKNFKIKQIKFVLFIDNNNNITDMFSISKEYMCDSTVLSIIITKKKTWGP